MKNHQSLGLVVEGNATSSLVLRLPSIAEELGPVKARVLRVARRLSNLLRAGYAVSSYEELQSSRLIFLRVPDSVLPRVVDELCASKLILKGITFVLCESCLSSKTLEALQAKGGATATIAPVMTLRKSWFVVEGQSTAIRHVRKFLQRNDARIFELRPGSKPLYFSAQLLATAFPVQLFAAAQQALRAAGISGNHLYDLLEEMSTEMFRSFSNGARITWPEARTGCPAETAVEYFDDLRVRYPSIAAVLDEQLALAMRHSPVNDGELSTGSWSSA